MGQDEEVKMMKKITVSFGADMPPKQRKLTN